MNFKATRLILIALASALGVPTLQAQHGHLNAGAAGTSQGDPLNFANGAIFSTSSGYVKQLDFDGVSLFAGNITLTALAATTNFGGPALGAPALGSFIQVRIESMMGPAGSTFSFWDEGALSPTTSMLSGSLKPSPLRMQTIPGSSTVWA
jgi:hypothetical protein